jgi:hypothetical protein
MQRWRPLGGSALVWWLATSVFVVQLGSLYTTICLPILILSKFGAVSELAIAIAIGSRILPAVLFSPFAAQMLSGRDARRVAASSSMMMAALVALLPSPNLFSCSLWFCRW